MAQLVAQTDWAHPKSAGTTFSITLSHTATAGDKLIFISAGGAIATPTGYTRRGTYPGGAQDISLWDFTAVGGETSVSVTLNGAENVAGTVLEFGSGLTYSATANNGSGGSVGTSNDFQVGATSANSVAAASLLIGVWSIATSSAYSLSNRFRQMGPLGKIVSTGAEQDASGPTQFIYAVGLADVTATAQYPQNISAGNYIATSTYVGAGAGATFAYQAVYTDTSGVATNSAAPNAIVAENSLPGTHNSNWFLAANGTNSTIAGYTDHQSYTQGSTVNFKVDSSGFAFRVEIYRIGWYGWETMSARNVLGNQAGYITGTITTQSAPTVDGTLGSTSCAWTTNASWTIPSNAPSGLYYAIFRRTDVTTNAATTHFIVKDSSVSGKATIVLPDLTHQAYNMWGATTDHGDRTVSWTGRSLYAAGADAGTPNFAHRAYAVSFDRPYGTQSTQTNTYIFDSEFGFIEFLEAQGYNLSYLSDTDLEGNNTGLNSAGIVLMVGHHEYWTADIYTAFQNAIANNVNTVVYSSNTALWHVRFAAGDTNHRTAICYKDSGTVDVSAGFTGTGRDPLAYTGTWRDTRTSVAPNNTDVRIENQFGQIFVASAPVSAASQIPYSVKNSPIWRNSTGITSLTPGQTYTSTVNDIGNESDSPNGYSLQPQVNVHQYTLSLTNLANAAGTIYSGTGNITIAWTLFRHSTSGALVFNTGNWRAFWAAARWQGTSIASAVDVNIQNAIMSLLYDLGAAPHSITALEPGLDTLPTDPSIGAPTSGNANIAKAYGITTPNIVQMTGFEHGSSLGLKNGVGGQTQFDSSNGAEGTNLIVQNSNVRTSGYALRTVSTTGQVGNVYWNVSGGTAGNSLPSNTAILVGRLWICVESQVNAGSDAPVVMQVGTTNGNVNFTYTESNGNLAVTVGAGSAQTALGAISLGVWTPIDFRINTSGPTWSCDWKVNGVSQTQATVTATTGSITQIILGPTSVFNINISYDDIVLSTTTTDYPLPDMHLVSLPVRISGTHVGSANFNQTINNGTTLIAISTPENLLMDLPPTVSSSTDAVAQITASSSSYLEFLHATTSYLNIYAVKHIIAGWQANASATTFAITLVSGSTSGLTLGSPATPISPSFQNSTTTLSWANKIYSMSPSGVMWTPTLVNSLLTRLGWATTVTGDPGINAAYIEVAASGIPLIPWPEPFNRVPVQRASGR